MSQRPVSDVALVAGTIAAVQTADSASDSVVSPVFGRLYSVMINVDTTISADTTFDILKNGADSLLDVTLSQIAADTGEEMVVPGAVEVVPGDLISIRSNGEQGAATVGVVGFVFRQDAYP